MHTFLVADPAYSCSILMLRMQSCEMFACLHSARCRVHIHSRRRARSLQLSVLQLSRFGAGADACNAECTRYAQDLALEEKELLVKFIDVIGAWGWVVRLPSEARSVAALTSTAAIYPRFVRLQGMLNVPLSIDKHVLTMP